MQFSVLFHLLNNTIMKRICSIILFSIVIYNATAQEDQAKKPKESKFEFTGFVDAYFQNNFNGKTPMDITTAFTPDNNSFSLGMAKLGVTKEVGKVSFGVDLGFGPRADVANGYSETSFGPIQQLYIAYSPTEKLKFTLGNFGTHVGYELIDANQNFHYSTSYMFSYGPFYHTGLKAEYALSDQLGVMVGVFNDTDNKFDVVPGKNYGAQLSYSGKGGDLYINYLGGKDGQDSVLFNQVDLTATFNLTDKLSLGVNSTMKSIDDNRDGANNTTWTGAALYLGYEAKEDISFGIRGEYFSDVDGAIFEVNDLNIIDLTASANIKVDALTFIPEFRIDIASQNVFENKNGDPTNLSPTFILAAVYSF